MDKCFREYARYLEDNYGAQFDREEGFVVCPECGEPIYACDWTVWEYTDEDDNCICPICGSQLQEL